VSGSELVVLRRGGDLWGVARSAIRSFRHTGASVRVELDASLMCADQIVGLVPRAEIHAAGALLRRFWPQPCLGLALFADRPVVVVDPAAPPLALCAQEGETQHGTEAE
jgi:hypothetical protein